MNLQDKNLVKIRINRETRILKFLGIEGLYVSTKKKSELIQIANNPTIVKKNLRKKVLFIGEKIQILNPDIANLFTNIYRKGMNLSKKDIEFLEVEIGPDIKDDTSQVNDLSVLVSQQIKIFDPLIVVCLGEKISQILLGKSESILNLRNKFHNLYNKKVLCTLDLKLLIENPSNKKVVWEDIKMVNREVRYEK